MFIQSFVCPFSFLSLLSVQHYIEAVNSAYLKYKLGHEQKVKEDMDNEICY